MIFLRVVALLALLPAIAAGEEGLLVSPPTKQSVATEAAATPAAQQVAPAPVDGPAATPEKAPAKAPEASPAVADQGKADQAGGVPPEQRGADMAVADNAPADNAPATETADNADNADNTQTASAETADPAEEKKALPLPKGPSRDWALVENPTKATKASVERGRMLYNKKGMCHVCHGKNGDGFGPVRSQFSPFPNSFFDSEWAASFTDGELMGVLTDGKIGTGMVPLVPEFISEEEGWHIINFLRTLEGHTTEAYEKYLTELKALEEKKQEAMNAKRF